MDLDLKRLRQVVAIAEERNFAEAARKRIEELTADVEVGKIYDGTVLKLLDFEPAEIRYLLEHKRTFVLKAELKTNPKFFYFYG